MRSNILFVIAGLMIFSAAVVFGQTARTVNIITEPQAVVWIDDIRRGTTNENGKLTVKNILPGIHKVRIRADNFRETTQTLTAAQKGDLKIVLVKTTDPAELAFQEAGRLSLIDRQKAIEAYRKAIVARPRYPEAQLEMARIMSDAGDNSGALKAIAAARQARPIYPEASAVEGRIYKADGEEEKAVASYKRAIREGKNFQPEAHAGLGLLYKDRADISRGENDSDNEKLNYDLATKELFTAAKQLAGAPDAIVIYQLVGEIYEKQCEYKKAIALYEEFLQIFPDAPEATSVRSFIVQIKKQMEDEQ